MTDQTGEDDLKTKVMTWLRKGGWPLEYEVGRAFRAAGFRAEQGRSYVDPLDGTRSREIDVLATSVFGGSAYLQCLAVVECKHSAGHPWVVLTSDAVAVDWDPIATQGLASVGGVAKCVPLSRPHAFGAVQALDKTEVDRGDQAYAAMNQAVSGAVGTLRRSQARSMLVLPVVVIDAPLFVLRVDDGKERLEVVDWYRLRWYGAQAFPEATAVDLVTRPFAGTYAIELRNEFQAVAVSAERVGRSIAGLEP